MNKFRNKRFNGAVYTFTHLDPMGIEVELRNTSSKERLTVKIDIRFSHHCFTVEFKDGFHKEHHAYTHEGEKRAFCLDRYELSRNLPDYLKRISGANIYRANEGKYRYMVDVPIKDTKNRSYSIFFTLSLKNRRHRNQLKLFVVSAYVKNEKPKNNAQTWRFRGLVAQVSDIFAGTGG